MEPMNVKLINPHNEWTPVTVAGTTYLIGIASGPDREARIVATGCQPTIGLSPLGSMDQVVEWWTKGFEAPAANTAPGRIVDAMVEQQLAERT